jgi:hypothetical protein
MGYILGGCPLADAAPQARHYHREDNHAPSRHFLTHAPLHVLVSCVMTLRMGARVSGAADKFPSTCVRIARCAAKWTLLFFSCQAALESCRIQPEFLVAGAQSMCARRVAVCAVSVVLLAALSLPASPLTFKSKRLTVLGTLTDDMTLGTQNSGWTIQLNPVIIVDGKLISSIQVKSSHSRQLESLEDKFVQAKGKLTVISGLDSSQRPVFELSSIKEHKGRKGFEP